MGSSPKRNWDRGLELWLAPVQVVPEWKQSRLDSFRSDEPGERLVMAVSHPVSLAPAVTTWPHVRASGAGAARGHGSARYHLPGRSRVKRSVSRISGSKVCNGLTSTDRLFIVSTATRRWLI